MTGRDVLPARLRGGFVGALCGATTLAAHGIAGGAVPGGASIVVLVLACGALGLAAGIPRRTPVAHLALILAAGQATGHLLLVLSAHHHGPVVTVPMVAAHVLAAVLGAALVAVTERIYRGLTSASGWIELLLTGVRAEKTPVTLRLLASRSFLAVRQRVVAGATLRGPPIFAVA